MIFNGTWYLFPCNFDHVVVLVNRTDKLSNRNEEIIYYTTILWRIKVDIYIIKGSLGMNIVFKYFSSPILSFLFLFCQLLFNKLIPLFPFLHFFQLTIWLHNKQLMELWLMALIPKCLQKGKKHISRLIFPPTTLQ